MFALQGLRLDVPLIGKGGSDLNGGGKTWTQVGIFEGAMLR